MDKSEPPSLIPEAAQSLSSAAVDMMALHVRRDPLLLRAPNSMDTVRSRRRIPRAHGIPPARPIPRDMHELAAEQMSLSVKAETALQRSLQVRIRLDAAEDREVQQ